MFDTVLGLPAHPLFVHGAVVLLPLMALISAIVAWRPPWWPRLAVPVAAANALVLVLVWVAKESGEKLEHRVDRTPAVHEHAELGDLLPLAAFVLLACSLVPAYLAWRARRDRTTSAVLAPRGLALATAVVTTLVALGVLILTLQVGHSGAVAVWGDVIKP